LTFEASKAALKPLRGEVKGILTRGQAVSSIGNAYADEILYEAGLFAFRKKSMLTPEELERLHATVYNVPRAAVGVLQDRMDDAMHKTETFSRSTAKVGSRALGAVHGSVRSRLTGANFCRTCQLGTMFD
jgi:formamidopyrimidine-DNA glycosylase